MTTAKSVLFVVDNFLVGGRETYLATLCAALRQEAMLDKAVLLCDQLEPENAQGIFADVRSVDGNWSLQNWFLLGSELLEKHSISAIWVHHYCVMQGLLLARRYGVSLIVTIHGPLLGPGRYSQESDALALIRSAADGAAITAVSQEICEQMFDIGFNHGSIGLLPNCIEMGEAVEKAPVATNRDRQFVLLCRLQKFKHIRAAARLVANLNRLGLKSELTIYTGARLNDHSGDKVQLLGRKWLVKHPLVWRYLSKIHLRHATTKPSQVVADADVVLGMGRVILEGMAAGKPCILIGYQHVVGLVTKENFDSLRYHNFSGRGVEPVPLKKLAKTVQQQLMNDHVLAAIGRAELHQVSLACLRECLRKTVSDLPAVTTPSSDDDVSTLDSDAVCQLMLSSLSRDQQQTFAHLIGRMG